MAWAASLPSPRRTLALAIGLGLFVSLLSTATSTRLERADFTYVNGSEPSSLDPALVTGVPEGRLCKSLFEGLVVKHPQSLEPLPGAAERWELSQDGLRYTFFLRPDGRWNGTNPNAPGVGEAVTAQDFRSSWKRLLHPTTASPYAFLLECVRGAATYARMAGGTYYSRSDWGLWLREQADNSLRAGITGLALEAFEDDPSSLGQIQFVAGEGDELRVGDELLRIGELSFRTPVAARVRAINRQPGLLQNVRTDPYYAGWCVELESAREAQAETLETRLADALGNGDLFRAEDFREKVLWPRVGLHAPSPLTLEVNLIRPLPYFLDLVSFYPLFPTNAQARAAAQERWPRDWEQEWLRSERFVGNGPFLLGQRRINDRIRLVKNDDYWDAGHVAFRTLDVLSLDHLGTALNLYLTGEVDWIDRVPPTQAFKLEGREDYGPEPQLGSYFYRFNVTRPPFDDPQLRRALALCVDRRALCEAVLKGGQVPAFSIVPPGFAGYGGAEMEHAPRASLDTDNRPDWERAHRADIERARDILKQAGYGPGAKPLPVVELLYNTSEEHRDVAEVIADGWKRELGMNVKLLNQEFKVYLDTQRSLDYDVSRAAWFGDYADPNTFLELFTSDCVQNRTGWSNAEYDALIARAARTLDPERRLEILREAESILLRELPVLPIYYYVTHNVVNPRLGGFFENIKDEHFPKFWYWKSDAELQSERAQYPATKQLVKARGPQAGLRGPLGIGF